MGQEHHSRSYERTPSTELSKYERFLDNCWFMPVVKIIIEPHFVCCKRVVKKIEYGLVLLGVCWGFECSVVVIAMFTKTQKPSRKFKWFKTLLLGLSLR